MNLVQNADIGMKMKLYQRTCPAAKHRLDVTLRTRLNRARGVESEVKKSSIVSLFITQYFSTKSSFPVLWAR